MTGTEHRGDAAGADVAFLFTDVEGSTRLWERHPRHMPAALERHDEILRAAVAAAGGTVVKTTGDGVMAVFADAAAAVQAALAAQRGLTEEQWGPTGPLRVRMGIHHGAAQVRDGDYFGNTVNRSARIMAAGHGGQVLLSAAAHETAAAAWESGWQVRDLGEHRLKDLAAPQRLFQVAAPGLPDRFPPLATLERTVNNLPIQATALVGRDAELQRLRALLDDPAVRMITLTGPGGTGKTRLALQAAAEQVDRFGDGVYFVDLSPDSDAEAAFLRVVRTASVTRALEEPPLIALQHNLRTRHVLLLLDNCEQVDGLGPAVAQVLAGCPKVTVLATSRAELHLRGEHRFPVAPLALPEADADSGAAQASEAVAMFIDRAAATQPGFVMDDTNAGVVVEICRRLDGLPLALELAAARLRLFSPAELLSRLGLQLLRGGPRDLPDRQQTLRATIEWSYELLDAGEQDLFALLGVFPDADVAAVEGVAGRCGLDRRIDVVEGLESLLAKSLLRQVAGPDGRSRFAMLQTIRDYAQEKLNTGPDAATVRREHAGYFAQRVAAAGKLLSGGSRREALATLEADLGNAQEAWDFFAATGATAELSQMLDSLWVLYQSRGWYHSSVGMAHDLLALLAAQEQTPQVVRRQVDLQTSLARALMALEGYTDAVEAAFQRALALEADAASSTPAQRFPVLRSLATLHQMRMDYAAGLAIGEQLLQLAQQQQDPRMLMDAHLVVGATTAFHGDVGAGMDHLRRVIELFEAHADATRPGLGVGPHPGVIAMTTTALLKLMFGFPDQADALAQRATQEAARLGHPLTRAYALFHAGYLSLLAADYATMAERADELVRLARSHDYPIWRALGMMLQSIHLIGAGQASAGVTMMDEALSLYRTTTAPPVFWASVLAIRAAGLGMAGRPADARPVIEEALRLTPGLSPDRAEFLIVEADIVLADPAGRDAARTLYREAHASAAAIGVRGSALIAATRLCQTADDEQLVQDGHVLRAVYDTFTEGHATPHLLAAAEQLRRCKS